jgi:amidase
VKFVMLLGEFMNRNYHARYYAKAQNMRYSLVEAYDNALSEVDVLVMPTLPQRATKLPAPDCAREENIDAALNMITNTAPFDTSGHPAISVPCAMSDSSPIGMMIVGKRYDDATVLRFAKAFEGLGDWKKF